VGRRTGGELRRESFELMSTRSTSPKAGKPIVRALRFSLTVLLLTVLMVGVEVVAAGRGLVPELRSSATISGLVLAIIGGGPYAWAASHRRSPS
jgi:hypothetical protein